MKRQALQIGHALELTVQWYDRVPEPPKAVDYQGEVIGWRDAQVIVRVRDYAILRFWKRTGREVGNPDHQRRGFSINVKELVPPPGVEVDLALADGQGEV